MTPGLQRSKAILFFLIGPFAAPVVAGAADSLPAPSVNLPAPAPLSGFGKTVDPQRLREILEPLRTDIAALSPDGRYAAYSIHDGQRLSVKIVDMKTSHWTSVVREVMNDPDATATTTLGDYESVGHVRWMGWTGGNRLVLESNRTALQFFAHKGGAKGASGAPPPPPKTVSGVIEALDPDGSNGRVLASPHSLSAPGYWPYPRVFDFAPGDDRSVLIRAPYGRGWDLFQIDTRTGHSKVLQSIQPRYGVATAFVLDQSGIDRIRFTTFNRNSFPVPYVYEIPSFLERSKDLDLIATADGPKGFEISPDHFFGPRSVPIGFSRDPSVCYFASNVDSDTFEVKAMNLSTGAVTDLGLGDPHFDLYRPSIEGVVADPDRFGERGDTFDLADRLRNANGPLVFDRYTRALAGVRYQAEAATTLWLDDEAGSVQRELQDALPDKDVVILEWDRGRRHYLVRAEDAADPGAFYLFDRIKHRLAKLANCSAASDQPPALRTLKLDLTQPSGALIRGRITLPAFRRIPKAPLVVVLPEHAWMRSPTNYQPQVAALAEMGFAVAQIDGPGVFGFGLKNLGAIDRTLVARRAEAISAWIQALPASLGVDPARTALLSSADGADLALHLLKAYPGQFRCAVAIDPQVEYLDLLSPTHSTVGEATKLYLMRSIFGSKPGDLLDHPEQFKGPVLVVLSPERSWEPISPIHRFASALTSAIRSHQGTADLDVSIQDFRTGDSGKLTEAFVGIETFLNSALYDFNVKVGRPFEVGK